MRFIFGFIFFGVLFYAIWVYFPESFQTLVTWASDIFNYIRDWIDQLSGKMPKPSAPPSTVPAAPKALFF